MKFQELSTDDFYKEVKRGIVTSAEIFLQPIFLEYTEKFDKKLDKERLFQHCVDFADDIINIMKGEVK